MLEASGFDFRNRHPQVLLIKLARKYGYECTDPVVTTAYGISLDLYRTFAPLKQTTPTMAFACLELAGRLLNEPNAPIWSGQDYGTWKVSRAMVMGEFFTFCLCLDFRVFAGPLWLVRHIVH